jgi:hypothetical protein
MTLGHLELKAMEWCNNEGLLIRIEEATEWNSMKPNVTLRAEWDIESVILMSCTRN